MNEELKGFDVKPSRVTDFESNGRPVVMTCDEDARDLAFWTVYAIYQDGSRERLADCPTKEVAKALRTTLQSQRSIPYLKAHEALRRAAHGVLANWDSGDLAAAVRTLAEAVRIADTTIEIPCADPQVVIVVEGGAVQHTLANCPGIDVVVIDYDTDDVESDELVRIPQADGQIAEAVCYGFTAEPEPNRVREIVKAVVDSRGAV